ncbi:MAG: ABC transporter permease [Clostridiales bacterium]|jgi:ribose transport system permease protein|nr:ABC transporter permease [Clostridiales bacterium]
MSKFFKGALSQKSAFAFYKKYGIYVILALTFLFFAFGNETFLSSKNVLNVARQVSMLGIATVAVTFLMIGGGVDLSIGGQVAITGIAAGRLIAFAGFPWPLAVLAAMLLCLGISIANTYFATKLNIFPMIVTLGTMQILNAMSNVATNGVPIYDMPAGLVNLGQGYLGPIPIPVVVFAVVVAIAWFLLYKTYFGRRVFAIGGNPEAARLSGIDVDKSRYAISAIAGFTISIAAILVLARNSSAQPNPVAQLPFDCMTACVLGGISFGGGDGKLGGAIAGVFIIGMLNNGMLLMGVDPNWQGAIKGLVLIAAVGIDCIQRKPKKVKLRHAAK